MSLLQSRGPSLLDPCRVLWSNKHTSASEYGFGRLWEFQVEILVRKFRIPDRIDNLWQGRCSHDDLLQWKIWPLRPRKTICVGFLVYESSRWDFLLFSRQWYR